MDKKRYLEAIIIISVIYFLAVSYIASARHNSFNSYYFDLGVYARKMWAILNSENLTALLLSVLAGRAEPILLILAPIYMLFQTPLTLIFIQNIIISTGAIILYLLNKKRPFIGFIMAITYLAFPATIYSTLFDFHPITFIMPLIFLYIYSINKARINSVISAVILLLREDASLTMFVLNFYHFYKYREKRFLYLSILSLIYFTFIVNALSIVAPAIQKIEYNLDYRYSDIGNDLTSIVVSIITNPVKILKIMFTLDKVKYLFTLFAPLLFTPIFNPVIASAVPSLAINLLSSLPEDYTITNHHSAIIISLLFISSSQFLLGSKPKMAVILSLLILTSTLMFNLVLFIAPNISKVDEGVIYREKGETFEKIMNIIPKNASVAVDQNIYPHVANYKEVFILPTKLSFSEKNEVVYADYAIFDRQMKRLHEQVFPTKQDHLNNIQMFIDDPCFKKIIDENDFILLKNTCQNSNDK